MTLKKLLSVILCLAMVLSLVIVPVSVAAEEDTLSNGLFVHYTFDEDASDVSGNGNNGTMMGDAALATIDGRSVLNLTGNSGSKLQMPGTLGTGLEDFTVSIVYNQSKITTNAFLWNLCGGPCTSTGNDGTGSFFYHPSNGSATRAVSTKDNWSSERNAYYKDANGNNTIAAANKWHQAIIVVKGYQLTLYVDGKLMDQITVDIKANQVPQSETNTYNTLGGSPYSADPYCTAYVDDFRMYNRALTNKEIAALDDLVGDGYAADDTAAVDAAMAGVTLPEVVSGNITLPETAANGTFIFWDSSDASVIAVDGTVTRGEDDQAVTMTATFTRGTIVKTATYNVLVKKGSLSAADIVALDAASIDLGDLSDVRSNISLPSAGPEGSSITWKSSDAQYISMYGIVTRPEELTEDINVTLTATVSYEGETATKEIVATFKAPPVYSDDMYAYMMAHFPNTSPYPTSFSLSLDGTTFTKVNSSRNQVTSVVGNGMTRDPYLMRGQDGTFHIIATDGWASPYIFSADSPDLVDWTAQRTMYVNEDLIKRGVMYTGGSYAYHAWAPECTYDETVGKYLIYWSADTNESLANGVGQIGTGYYQKTYACYTEDFINFETPFVMVDPGFTMIDPTIYTYGGRWYMISKNEENQSTTHPAGKRLIWGEAEALAGPWTIHNTVLITEENSMVKEGPTVYREIGGNEGWFLAWDYFGNSRMGVAYTTTPDDMTSWKIQPSSIATDVRHPSVITITETEYHRILDAFQPGGYGYDLIGTPEKEYPEAPEVTAELGPILRYTFEADTIVTDEEAGTTTVTDVSGHGNDGTLMNAPTFEADAVSEDGQSLRLTNNNVNSSATTGKYVAMPSQVIADLSDITISAWFYPINQTSASRTQQGRLFDFGTGPSSGPTDYFFFTTQDGSSNTSKTRFSITTSGSGSESSVNGPNRQANTWHNVVLTIKGDTMYYYYDGQLYGSTSGISAKPYMLDYSAAYLGRSMWSSDKYFNGRIDDFRIYNRAVTADEAAAIYAGTDSEDAAKFAIDVDSIDLGDLSAVESNIALPTTLPYGSTVVWSSDKPQFISEKGKVVRPARTVGKAPVTLTAVVTSADGQFTQTLKFDAIVNPYMPIDCSEFAVAAYSAPLSKYGVVSNANQWVGRQANALHLAITKDGGKTWEALNGGNMVLTYAASASKTSSSSKQFTDPYIFQKEDGTYVLLATALRYNQAHSDTSIVVWDSEDMVTWKNQRLVTLGGSRQYPVKPQAFSNGDGTYTIVWQQYNTEDVFCNIIADDFRTVQSAQAYTGIDYPEAMPGYIETEGMPEGTVGSIIPVKEETIDALLYAYGTPDGIPTGAEDVAVETSLGVAPVLPETATINLTGGGTKTGTVVWEEIDPAKYAETGSFTVTGYIEGTPNYVNPFHKNGGDPDIFKGPDGYYYYTSSYMDPAYSGNAEYQYDRINIRRAKTIAGLEAAEDRTIFWRKDSGVGSYHIWAPEIHYVQFAGEEQGTWVVYFAAAIRGNQWSINNYALVCDSQDPMTGNWTDMIAVAAPNKTSNFELDATVFEHNGKWYRISASKPNTSNLVIAELTSLTTVGDQVTIATPTYNWENSNDRVLEGPTVMKANGLIYLCYAAGSTDSSYMLGCMTAIDSPDTDLMDPASWTKMPYPIMTSETATGQFGPGHATFSVAEDGVTPILSYMTRPGEAYNNNPLYVANRWARVAIVYFHENGNIFLADPPVDGYLPGSYVTATVTVTEPTAAVVSVEADKDICLVNEEVTLTVKTATDIAKLGVFNEVGKGLSQLSASYVDNGIQRTWTVVVRIGTKGNRTITVKGIKEGEAFADVEALGDVNIAVYKELPPSVEPVKPEITKIEAPETAKAKEAFTITVTTTQAVAKVGLFNETGAGITAVKSYTDEGDARIWTLSTSVGSAGARTIAVKIAGADGEWIEGENLSIKISK